MTWATPRTWSVGEILTASNMNTYISADLNYIPHEWDYAQITANVNCPASATTTVVTGNAVTYDGGRVKIEFWAPSATSTISGGVVTYKVQKDSADFDSQILATGSFLYIVVFDTPTAASHTYRIQAVNSSGTNAGTVTAGTGGSNPPPAYLRVTSAKSNP